MSNSDYYPKEGDRFSFEAKGKTYYITILAVRENHILYKRANKSDKHNRYWYSYHEKSVVDFRMMIAKTDITFLEMSDGKQAEK